MINSSWNIRKTAFCLKDYLSGNIIRNHLKEIQFLMEDHNSSGANDRKEELLKSIISHAIATTPFYTGYDVGNSILTFPVVNKSLIRNHFEDFRSESFKKESLFRMTTSGSTGTPFTVYQDLNKKHRNYADTLYFARMAGYEIGHRLYYLKIWSENNKKTKLQAWQQNILPIDVLKLDDEVVANLIRNIEKGKSCKGLLGYASAFDVIVQYFVKNGASPINGNIRSAIAISESLNSYTKQQMAKYFNTNVVSRYSNLENGILAQQCINNEEFHINAASYYIEIFDLNKDVLVEPGTLGRIIVTDLFNYAMPMIRYDTGDIGIFSPNAECNHKSPCLTRIEGRKLDLLYDTNGNLISSYIVYKNMWKYPEIIQYQLIQEGEKAYRFIININGTFTREKKLIEEFKTYLGSAADFKVEYVSEIPLLSSGKRKKIINNYIKH